MPKFAANLTTMYPEFEVPQRFVAAREAGFRAIEFLQPYAYDKADIGSWLNDNNLRMILLNTPMGDAKNGERGLAALPGREEDFRGAFSLALDYAVTLSIPMIHVMAGVVPAGVPRQQCETIMVANLQQAADMAGEHNIRLQLEPLNGFDVPGYLHTTTPETIALLNAIGRTNVQLQYDFYHLQLTQGNLAAGVRDNLDIIGHIQFSSVPGRNEPQYGEVNLPFLLSLLDELGYDGYVGCEYRPKNSTAEGLVWAQGYDLGRT
jgi:2-dehydrotetronate isomerase